MERDRDEEAEDLKCSNCREPIYHGHRLRRLQDCVNNDGRIVVTDEHDQTLFCGVECMREYLECDDVQGPRAEPRIP